MKPIRLVCATRKHPDRFIEDTALGRSLKSFQRRPEQQLLLFGNNSLGLSTVYNQALKAAEKDPAILVFIHDDIYLCDLFWTERIYEGLQTFDVIGLAGNTRRVPRQPGWAFTTAVPNLQFDDPRFLSGTVGHGKDLPGDKVAVFGPSKQECKLLDGLFLAADSEVLNRAGVRFDERFSFHFYDLDFCREVERKGLRMGTWPISVVHQSAGAFGSPGWVEGYEKYLAKYPDSDAVPGTEPPKPASSAENKARSTAEVYQIFYNDQTRKMLDPGFIPLDNVGQRPDWCEYWPIRTFLLNNAKTLDENKFYGFLSPKFKAKAGLSAQQVHEFVATMDESVDVVALSPFLDHTARHQNIFMQGVFYHPNAASAFVSAANVVAPGVSLNALVTDSTNTIFCNYFLAKPRFWRHWLSKAEMIFALAERSDTPLGKALTESTIHRGVETLQSKVFFMERLVTLLLATEDKWQARFYDPERLPLGSSYAHDLPPPVFECVVVELAAMDRLKQTIRRTGQAELLQLYERVLNEFLQKYHAAEFPASA